MINKTKNSDSSLRRNGLVVLALAVLLVAGLGGWSATTSLSNAAVGEGTVIIDDSVKKIQHLQGGIVSKLFVREGQHVEAGEIILQLDSATARANLGIVESSLAQLYVRRSRLQAESIGAEMFSTDDLVHAKLNTVDNIRFVDGEMQLFSTRRSALLGMKKQLEKQIAQLADEVKGHQLQIDAIDRAIVLLAQETAAAESLYEKRLLTLQRLNALKRQWIQLDGDKGERLAARAQAETKIAETGLQILQLDEDRRNENSKELTDVDAKIAEMEERRMAGTDQLDRLDIKAPVAGRVFQLEIHTIGGVVAAGEQLMLLAPDQQSLTVDTRIATRNIDQIFLTQHADIRFSAFDQRTTPEVKGEVIGVSPDVVTDQRTGMNYYSVRVKPTAESLSQLKGLALYPGMPAEVFIRVADRTVISYLTKPIIDQMNHTFRE
ncbi:HlyD family type I secretion periplasmic adaptor subunit [Rhizobium sp.]|uniref:HlyD family type I secretion periplasmic adaptor subunit n=1 Tax=Rhizobium sp. TaxID=391 RepID=UPI0028AE913B